MSGSASLGLEQQLLDHTLGIAPMATLSRVYVALCQVDPPPAEDMRGIEVSGGGYARVPASFVRAGNVASNSATIEFPAATGSWGTVGYFEIWTAATGGSRQYWGPLVDPSDSAGQAISVTAGDILRFSAGTLMVQALDVSLPADGPWLPLTGGTLSGDVTVGTGTGTPRLTLNGAVGAGVGVDWQGAGVVRWRLETDGGENLALNAYDGAGTWYGTAVQFGNNASSIVTNFPIIANATNATVVQGVTGLFATATNSGPHAAQGAKFGYFSSSGAGDGFDTGLTSLAIFDPTSWGGGPIPFYQSMWGVAVSPNDTAHNWNCIVGEFNVTNRGADMGWKRDRGSANPTGGFLLVPETNTFGGTGGGEGKNATFAISIGRSGGSNSTGFPAKWYNGLLIEPNSIVGQTGRAFYATGDITGTASQYPYGPMQTEGTWLHGIDHTKATYVDGRAETLLVGQSLGWIVGPTTAPTAVATIAGSGSGANASLTLTAAGTGSVILGKMPTNAATDAAAASAGVPIGGVYRNGSVLMVRVA